MDLYRAQFMHPTIGLPLIVYFNKSDGYVIFEKDDEIIEAMLQRHGNIAIDKGFLKVINEPQEICSTTFTISTFKEVYELLGKMGVNRSKLHFKQLIVH